MNSISKIYLQRYYRTRGRSRRELYSIFSLIFVVLVSLFGLSFLSQMRIYAQEIPTEESIRSALENKGENSRIFDRSGELLYTFKDPERDRVYVDYAEIPRTVVTALLAAEDAEFFIHGGVDFVSILAALASNVNSGGHTMIGGSTITQQLVKQTLLDDSRTLDRKVVEAMVAVLVERDYSKEQILEFYLNSVSFGGRVQGIETAAHVYFNKSASSLSLGEAATLVSLIQSPSDYSPLYAVDKVAAVKALAERRVYVIDQIRQKRQLHAFLETGDYDFLKLLVGEGTEKLSAIEYVKYPEATLRSEQEQEYSFNLPSEPLRAPHWVFYIRDLLQKAPYNISLRQLYSGGFDVFTSLDIRVQDLAEQKLKEGVDRYGPAYGFSNGSLVSIDATSGEIIAMVGSKGYYLPSDPNDKKFDPKVNVAVALQSLGSSLKPWVAYQAFAGGKYSPNSIVKDSAQRFYGSYSPKNFDGRFWGDMTIRKALLESRNLPFLKLQYELGDWRLGALMQRLGYRAGTNYGLAAAIGGVDESLLAHTGAYTGLANGGEVLALKPVLSIKKRTGAVVFQSDREVIYGLDRQAVAEVNNILGDKSFRAGTYSQKFIGGYKLAGKTGTSDNNRDTYYIGYGPKIVTGVWSGNNDNSPMSGSALGSTTSLLVWNGYMRSLLANLPQYGVQGSY